MTATGKSTKKDIRDIRKDRLQLWVAQFPGELTGFCEHYHLNHSRRNYIQQVLASRRKLGEKAARRIEREGLRPEGWLDGSQTAPAPVEAVLHIDVERCGMLPPHERERIEEFIAFTLARWEEHQLMASGPSIPDPKQGPRRQKTH